MPQVSPALPLAGAVLRVAIVLNWAMGALIAVLLVLTLVAEEWTFTALGISPALWGPAALDALRAIAVLGLVSIPVNHGILARLLAMVGTVRDGDPFVAANARRLQVIAWLLLALELLGLAVGVLGKAVSTQAHPLHLDAGFSASGLLAVILTFVLARVFAEGARMRDDLEGTV